MRIFEPACRSTVAASLLLVAVLASHVAAQAPAAGKPGQQPAVGKPGQQPGSVKLARNPAAGPSASSEGPAAGQRPGQSTGQPGSQPAGGTRPGAAQAGPPQAGAPRPPFFLTVPQEDLLNTILTGWELRSAKTKTFKCTFTRYEYDPTYSDDEAFKKNKDLKSKADGVIKFKAPDHGEFEVTTSEEFDLNSKKYEKHSGDKDNLEHWVCDGEAIYEFVPAQKQLQVHPLPEEMRGEAIADGPVPFIFGAKVDKLKARYWMRDVTPKEWIGKQTYLEVFPKYQRDAANFARALVLLDDKMTLIGVQIVVPGGNQTTNYTFSKVVVNDPFGTLKGDFAKPALPRGWKKVIDPPAGSEEEERAAAPPIEKRQAKADKPGKPALR